MPEEVKKYDYPSSHTGGVRPLSIRGIFDEERVRLSEEFTDADRQYRAKWLKDQYLDPDEPRPMSQELYREIRNPIRRFLSKPWQVLENAMIPVCGKTFSTHFRWHIPKFIVGTFVLYALWYGVKYRQNDWTRAYGVQVLYPKPVLYPGDPGYPAKRDRFVPSDYDNHGFKDRKVFLD